MIAAVLLFLLIPVAAEPADTPRIGDCGSDPAALAAQAEDLIPSGGASNVARARELLRRARRFSPSAALRLRASDLATVAGDAEEAEDLLAEAADSGTQHLSPPEILVLALRAERRRRWEEALDRYDALVAALAARGERASWIVPRRRELAVELAAESIAPPAAGPSVEARLALADGRRALAENQLSEAREKIALALRFAPSYPDALLALGAVETRAGRSAQAIRAYRDALAADPDRFEALASLSNLLWERPDRADKEESLILLDRAAARRPDQRSLWRISAARHAEIGDAAAARDRLSRFLAEASPVERAEVEPLRLALAQGAAPQRPAPTPTPAIVAAEPPPSDAVGLWRKARVHFERGDPASLETAAALVAKAEKLDPSLPNLPELAAAIHERRGEWAEAEAALRRAIRIDPSRASLAESLARVVGHDPARAVEAEAAWRDAERAGSTEAIWHLAESADRGGRRRDALALYRRYLAEAPAGVRSADAASAVARLEGTGRGLAIVAIAVAAVAAALATAWTVRRRSGKSIAEWLERQPARAAALRPIVGRLRHEAFKHGGLLLADAAARLESPRVDVRRDAATLLLARVFGEPDGVGLIGEANECCTRIVALAGSDGVRLNLRRDPLLGPLVRGLDAVRGSSASLRRVGRGADGRGPTARAARLARKAAELFASASVGSLDRLLDRATALPVRLDALNALLVRVAAERGVPAPPLEGLGALAGGGNALPPVRISAADWETIWRNLFDNAFAAAAAAGAGVARLGLLAENRRDPVTGQALVRVGLADDVFAAVDGADIRQRPPERGWGVVSEILRDCDGTVDVVGRPGRGYAKALTIELPAAEEPR